MKQIKPEDITRRCDRCNLSRWGMVKDAKGKERKVLACWKTGAAHIVLGDCFCYDFQMSPALQNYFNGKCSEVERNLIREKLILRQRQGRL